MKRYMLKKGMTLVEMMVSISILVMAMGGFSLLFFRAFETNSFVLEEGLTAMSISHAVDVITSDLRRVRQADNGDYPIVSGTDFDLKVFVDIDNDGAVERVHYFLNGDTLERGVTEPVAGTPVTYPSTDDTVFDLAHYVVNTASEPLFTYYNNNYPGDAVNNPLAAPIAVGDVRLIRVWVRMNIDPIKAPNNVNIESFAELRNLNDY